MKIATLFFNAMRMSTRIDCRWFAMDPKYHRSLERELFDGMALQRAARPTAEKPAAGTVWRAA